MFSLFNRKKPSVSVPMTSELYDESTFYKKFISDLQKCSSEVIIESPYITINRIKSLFPVFELLIAREVNVYIITRDPSEHNDTLSPQSEAVIQLFEQLGVQVLLCKGNHHRKLAILDREILWEGSLNILSQTKSREIMRRIPEKQLTLQMFNFLKFERIL